MEEDETFLSAHEPPQGQEKETITAEAMNEDKIVGVEYFCQRNDAAVSAVYAASHESQNGQTVVEQYFYDLIESIHEAEKKDGSEMAVQP